MPWTREKLLAFLDSIEVGYEEAVHSAVFTMAESADLRLALSGCRCKSLFVQNKKGSVRCLVVTSPEAAVDLGALGRSLGCGRLSLCPIAEMMNFLGVESGALSPFSLVADVEAKSVRLVLDERLRSVSRFLFHPLVNTATVSIDRENFSRFLAAVGRSMLFQQVPLRGDE